MNKDFNEQTEISVNNDPSATELKKEQTAEKNNSEINNAPNTSEEKTADDNKENSVSLGKFKDVSALLSAYNSLEAEFTKRCQRIKELEAEKRNGDKAADIVAPKNSEVASDKGNNRSEQEREEILKGYLKEVMEKNSKAIIMDGQGRSVKTPIFRPCTVEEAGKLAKNLLEKNK